jgi:hypothetical protein
MTVAIKLLAAAGVAFCVTLSPANALDQPTDADLKVYAVHVNRTPKQNWPGYGIYLGAGLVLTASHVPGNFADTKPHVVIAGQDLPSTLVKQGELEIVDLTLLAVDADQLPVSLRMRRMPLCARPPYPGERVVVVTPEGTARSSVLPPFVIPPSLRARFGTAIADVANTGNSGSGVFDADNRCLLGIISRKLSVFQQDSKLGSLPRTKDIGKYFVPSPEIKAFIPAGVSY